MHRNTLRKPQRELINLIILAALITAFTSLLERKGAAHLKAGHPTSPHQEISIPALLHDKKTTCNTEAAAYAAALNALYDARRGADEAYRRWYECEQLRDGDDRMPLSNADQPPILSAEYSVLYASP